MGWTRPRAGRAGLPAPRLARFDRRPRGRPDEDRDQAPAPRQHRPRPQRLRDGARTSERAAQRQAQGCAPGRTAVRRPTGRVLWERNPEQVLPIASLTKMMTARRGRGPLAADRPGADHAAGCSLHRLGVGLLPVHKRVPELPLLYGLLLPSGNDAAIALAQHVAGSQPAMIAMMNERARQLGLACTHFTTVSGIVDQGQSLMRRRSCAARARAARAAAARADRGAAGARSCRSR